VLALSGGTATPIVTLENDGVPGPQGVLGLAVDAAGYLYAALDTLDASRRGVWRLDPSTGTGSRLEQSGNIAFPNGLVLDSRGNLYVSSSSAGQIWRFPPGAPGELWFQDSRLMPDLSNPLPQVGANGLAFGPPNLLYVAQTQAGFVARIPIEHDGTPGSFAIVAQGLSLLTVDGIAVDATGNLHGVIPGFGVFGTAPLVVIDVDTGMVAPTPTDVSLFARPFSVAFGCGRWDPRRLYVTNGSPTGVPAPGVVQTLTHVPGRSPH
jgi:sugar lactone lactonase YvrE